MIDFCRVVVRLLLYIHIFLFVSFAISQIVRMFVVFNNVIGKRKPAICVGIFYVIIYYFVVGILKDIRLLPPCGTLMRPQPMTVLNDGKGQPFFLSIMPNCSIVMAELVIQNSNGSDVTTSLIVAQVFGKNHKDVLRDIEKLSCSEDFRMRNFAHTPYTHPQNGQVYHYYEMTKDGFSFLVMGYTGAKAGEFKEKFISEFNKREMMLKDDDYILMRSQQILQKRVEAAEQRVKALEADNAAKEETIELQQKEIALAAPKVQYVDTVLKSVNTYATNLIAKEMGMSAETLNKRLKEKGIQYRQSGVWVLTSRYQDKGYTKTRTHTYTRSDGSQSTAMLTVWTEQGREFLHSLFKA